MANVNIGQIRSIVQNLPAGQHVTLQAGVLLAILNGYKGLNSNTDIAVAKITGLPSDARAVDLTGA